MPNAFRGYHTESAGTAILEVVPAVTGMIPRITRLVYANAATEHTVTFMKPVAKTVTTGPMSAGSTALPVASTDPGKTPTTGADESVAANDYVIFENENGGFEAGVVSSASDTTITLSAGSSYDVKTGAGVWVCYEVGRATHLQVKLIASVTTTIEGVIQAGFHAQQGVKTSRSGVSDPMLVYIDNITNAGKLHSLCIQWAEGSNVVAG